MRIYLNKDLYLLVNSIKNNSSIKTSHFLATLVKHNQGVYTYTPVEISSYNPNDWDTKFFSDFPHQNPEHWDLCSPIRLDLAFKKQFGSILPFHSLAGVTPPEVIKSSSIFLPSIRLNEITRFQNGLLENPALDASTHLTLMSLHCVEKNLQKPDDISGLLKRENLLNLEEIQELKHDISKNLDVSKSDLYHEVQAFFSS